MVVLKRSTAPLQPNALPSLKNVSTAHYEGSHTFQYEIDRFIVENLSANPLLGHLYHKARSIRRIIFEKRYNIYYTIRDDSVFVMFIFDGRMDINQQIKEYGLDLGEDSI